MVEQKTKTIIPNLKQKECIETLDGSVMVLAGPGTGKTFTVIQRIKHMLETGINPSSILCLTFSNAAANEMKARVVTEIGAGASAITVNTYHSFCNEIIKNNPDEFELLNGVSLVDELTKRALMKDAIDEVNPKFYRTKWGDAYHFIPELLDSVKEIKSSRITKEEYFNTLNTHPDWQGQMDLLNAEYAEREQKGKLVPTFITKIENHKRKIGKAKETWDIYEAYDINLKKNNFIDFDDMISLVLDVFETNEDLLKRVSSQFKYFLVDEYQDTNYSENSIVFKLAEGTGNENIFVVGDDDQIIYEFQGAKTDTLQKFLIRYPNTKVICLNENNRSTQNILDFSYKLISQDTARLEYNKEFSRYKISKKLTAKNPKIIPLNKKIQIHGFSDTSQENNYIISDIKKHINSQDFPFLEGEKDLSKIAILTRDNNELTNFAKLLEAENIQYQVKVNKNIFDIRSSILVYFYLQTLENHLMYADKMFALLLAKPFEFNPEDYNFLFEQNKYNHKDLITNIKDNLNSHNWQNGEKVNNFIKTYDYLQELKSTENIKNLIIETVNRTGILEYFIGCDINKTDNIYAVKKMIDEAQGLMSRNPAVSLSDYINHIEMSFASEIPIPIDKEEYTQNAVQLLTIHSSKGREFDYVYVPNLISRKWENRSNVNKKRLPIESRKDISDIEQAKKSEQLRLLFVAVTRAKHFLMLSCSNLTDGAPQEMTSYISNIINDSENLVELYKHEFSAEEYLKELTASVKKAEFDYKTAFESEIKARIKEFVLSPSSLNSYLNCPREFLYSHLLKIPVYNKTSDNASYGSAFHKALELTVRQAKETGMYPNKTQVYENFIKGLNCQKLETIEKRLELEQRASKSIDILYSKFSQIPISRIFATEFNIDKVPFETHFLKGFVDRIEINSDGTYEMYDYKTNSAKSKTSISDGGDYECYLNQLRFYKYAFEQMYPSAKVSRAGLLFVEDFSKNFYINLTQEDNDNIKEKISFAYKNIDNLNFKPGEKNDSKCKYCNYKEFCTLDLL